MRAVHQLTSRSECSVARWRPRTPCGVRRGFTANGVRSAEHPTAEWTAQQVVEAFPDDTAPRWLHRDRDSACGDVFRRRVAGMGIAEVVSAAASPWQNPYAERVIGSHPS